MNLPDEIIAIIFMYSFDYFKKIYRLRFINKQFYRVSKQPHIFKYVSVNPLADAADYFSRSLIKLHKLYPHIQKVHAINTVCDHNFVDSLSLFIKLKEILVCNISDEISQYIAQKLKLEEICLFSSRVTNINFILANKYLHSIDLSFCDRLITDSNLKTILEDKRIKKFNLSQNTGAGACNIFKYIANSHLTELYLSYVKFNNNAPISDFESLQHNKTLTNITIIACYDLTDDIIVNLSKIKTLKKLDLGNSKKATDKSIRQIACNYNIKNLTIYCFDNITYQNGLKYLKNNKNLQKLKVTRCNKIDKYDIYELQNNHKNLLIKFDS